MANMYLKDLSFTNSDFNCINFSGSILESCNFEKVNFLGADLTKANIMRCKFIDCKINSCNFFDAILYSNDFDKSDLINFDTTNNLHLARIIYDSKNLHHTLLEKIKKEQPTLLEKPDIKKLNRWFDDKYVGK